MFFKKEKFKIANPTGPHFSSWKWADHRASGTNSKTRRKICRISACTHIKAPPFSLSADFTCLFWLTTRSWKLSFAARLSCSFRGLQFLNHAPCKLQTVTELEEFTTVNDILSFCLRTSFEGVRLLSTRCRVTTSTKLPKSRC